MCIHGYHMSGEVVSGWYQFYHSRDDIIVTSEHSASGKGQ